MSDSPIRKCETLIREIANEFALNYDHSKGPFKNAVKNKFKFQNDDDWSVLVSLLDVLGDTEMAKLSFERYGITEMLPGDLGEKYLRLYGFLSAIYLQASAVINFLELVKLPGKKSYVDKIKSLGLVKLRHKLAAHTIDFADGDRKESYQLVRISLAHSIVTVDSKNRFKSYSLKDLTKQFDNELTTILKNAIEKFISNGHREGKKKEKYLQSLIAIHSQ